MPANNRLVRVLNTLWPQYKWDAATPHQPRCLVGVLLGDIDSRTHTDYMNAWRAAEVVGCGSGIKRMQAKLLADLVGDTLRRAVQ